MNMQEECVLRNKIDMLEKDNQSKSRIIAELYNIIVETGNVDLLTKVVQSTLDAQEEN